MEKLRLGVLGSGTGSNFRALWTAIQEGRLEAEVAVVVTDQPGSGIGVYADEAGIRTVTLHEARYRSRLSPEVERELVSVLQNANVDLVVLAGYMRMVKRPLLDAFPGRVINIHPSLLPKFPGLEAWKQALEAGEKVTGCTVHYVDAGMDTGEIIARAEVPILADDTPESLHARIQQAEHILYPKVVGELTIPIPSLPKS